MNCLVCSNKIQRNNSKIECSDCKNFFHLDCVNLTKDDAAYYQSSDSSFRCDKCTTLRRRSLQTQTSSYRKPPRVIDGELNNKTLVDPSATTATASVVSEPECTLQMVLLKLTELEKTNRQFLEKVNALHSENLALKSKVNALESRLNWQHQLSLVNDIDIVGVPHVNNSNCLVMAKEIFSKALNITLCDSDIEKCHVKNVNNKAERYSSSQTKSNIISVRFSNLTTKQRILSARTKNKKNLNSFASSSQINRIENNNSSSSNVNCNGDNSSSNNNISRSKRASKGIFINDSLTKYTQALFMKAKEICKQRGAKYVWYKNNQILVRKIEGEKVISIKSFNDLAHLEQL